MSTSTCRTLEIMTAARQVVWELDLEGNETEAVDLLREQALKLRLSFRGRQTEGFFFKPNSNIQKRRGRCDFKKMSEIKFYSSLRYVKNAGL